MAIIGGLLGLSHEGPHLAQQHSIVSSAQLWHCSPRPNPELSHRGHRFSGRGKKSPQRCGPFPSELQGCPSTPSTSASPCSQHGQRTPAELAPLQHKRGFLYVLIKLRNLSFNKLFCWITSLTCCSQEQALLIGSCWVLSFIFWLYVLYDYSAGMFITGKEVLPKSYDTWSHKLGRIR